MRTSARILTLTLLFWYGAGHAEGRIQTMPVNVIKVEPAHARVEVLGCNNDSTSLHWPKWLCEKHRHGEVIDAYRTTYEQNHKTSVVVMDYDPTDPLAVARDRYDAVEIVLHEVD